MVNWNTKFKSLRTFIIVICVIVFSGSKLYSQEYPFVQNDFKSEISDFILSHKDFNHYDFIILKYAECYWFDRTEYRLICFSENNADLITITRKKKNNKIKIGRKRKGDFEQVNYLVDSLRQIGLFTLTVLDLETKLINQENGRITTHSISDGILETFEIYQNDKTWGLSVYEAVRYYDFCGNENLLKFNNACRLLDKTWSYKNVW
ncbi:hypothetical protein [Aureibacter tunicatorum]|uniref:Uncharacterized protein n=1 Tax=Aureibacter tunicatorum TaxID=866807 RepID=A0AAE4BUW3_9BACT|nr:hypothetical protein [Aureibacter tunicatorum]MDR6241183.1 hypothetical protein [Aureibacter tunicatorum]BDD03958.1 hypothetical protein AUTU_14410 [Aureibacter tunicatorum]